MDLVTVFHVAFVVGLVAISILYVLFGTGERPDATKTGRQTGAKRARSRNAGARSTAPAEATERAWAPGRRSRYTR